MSARRVFAAPSAPPDPEPSPKWLALAEVVAEIHRAIHSGQEVSDTVEEQMETIFEMAEGAKKDPGTILILTRDDRTCTQLNTFLKYGSKELLDVQFRKHFSNHVSTNTESEGSSEEKKNQDEETQEEEELGDAFVLTLTQSAFMQLESSEKTNLAGCFEESFLLSQTIDKPSPDNVEEGDAKLPVIVLKAWKKDVVQLAQYFEDLKPRWIVMYDVDMTVVRQLEVFQRCHSTLPLTVYFLIYGGTVEEQAYLTSLRKEKEAFDFLIEEKGRLVIPEDRSDCPELSRDAGKASEALGGFAVDSRKGGVAAPSQPGRIIVDMREFRSELPALIHSRGIDIEPLTITVGDYILTPDICLERKSVSDLIQSLNSGRLYNQAKAMTRHYARPMLLIEFDKDKPFDLQDRYYLSTDSSSELLVTKLQLLTLHFPQLRLVWSPSPHATAALFQELKEGQPEPDPATAVGIGVEETPTDLAFNPAPQSFLQHLPGVTTKNLPSLLRKGGYLDNLSRMTVDELNKILENSAQAQALYDAIHKRHEPEEGASGKRPLRPGATRGSRRKRFHQS